MPRERLTARPFLDALGAGAVFAILFGCAFPPLSLWPLVVLAPMPLCWIAWRTARPARSALAVFLATLPMWMLVHSWLFQVTLLGTPVLAVILALYPAIFVWALARLRPRLPGPSWVYAALLWTGLEYLRGEVIGYGYPWFLLGHPTIESGAARMIASLGGVYAVSLCLFVVSVLLMTGAGLRTKGARLAVRGSAALAVAGLIAGAGSGSSTTTSDERPVIRIAVVQTNVPSSNKVDWTLEERVLQFRRMVEMTDEAADFDPDLIVWPETMFPGYTLSADVVNLEPTFSESAYFIVMRELLLEVQASLRMPMLVGSVGVEGVRYDESAGEVSAERVYNSVFLLEEGEARGRYDKLHLTPFGEVMPYISAIDWLERLLLFLGAPGMSFDLDAGGGPVHFDVRTATGGTVRVVTPICFEATVGRVCRRLVTAPDPDAALIINVTNDGWFGSSDAGRRHHAMLARWRAAELGVPVVRAANTGISQFIEAGGGSVGGLQPARTEGVLVVDVPVGGERGTLFGRTGNVAGVVCAASLLALLPAAWRRPRARVVQAASADGTMEMESDSKEPTAT